MSMHAMLNYLSIFIDIIRRENPGRKTEQRSQQNLYLPPLSPIMLPRNTKKFFQKTLNGFKSFFSSSSDYQRIPNTTSPQMSIWKSSSTKKEIKQNGSFMKFSQASQTKNVQADSRFNAASCLLAEMLKELELMDISDVDHVLDIEEFIHYYSRLTCPTYVDIVDKFFFEIYAEFFGHSATRARIASRPKLRS